MNTGHEGSLSTIHANSPRDALNRLETMVLMAGYELPVKAIREHVAAALDVIVQLDRVADGTRKIMEVVEVQRMEGDIITLQQLFRFKLDRVDADNMVVGRLEPTGLRPLFLPKFARHGIELPESMFGDKTTAMFGIENGQPVEWQAAGER
jgi:pilus assembly protein CpaF